MHKINILALLAALVLSGCAAVEPRPLTVTFLPERGEFMDADGARLSFHQTLNMAAGADYVVMGEGHRNGCDHDMQQRVVRGLVRLGRMPAIGLEMVPVDKQPVLDRFMAGEVTPVDLEKELEWKTIWGYPYALFEPLFEMASQNGLPLAGLNAPKRVTAKASREGLDALSAQDRAFFPSRVIPHLPEQREELLTVFEQHESLLDETRFEQFLLVQSVWDSMMAEQVVALSKRSNRPVVVVAGAGHVDMGRGVPRRIAMLDPGASVVTLVPLRDLRWFRKGIGTAAFYCPESYQSRMGMTLEVRQGRVVVVEVLPGRRAAAAGIRPGDALVRAQGREVRGLMDLHRAGKLAHDTNKPLVLVMDRYGQRVTVDVGKLGQTNPGQGKLEQNKPEKQADHAEEAMD